MLSRVAENIYWLARYLERAEDMARLISVNSHLLLDFPHASQLGWESLISITSTEELFAEHYERPDEAKVLEFLCGDRRYGSSIISSMANARENLRTSREILPREIWEEVNQLYLNIAARVEAGVTPRNRDSFLKQVIRSCQTVTGLIEGTLSHTQTRTFLTLGRSLERADMTTRIIDVRSANLLPKTPEDLKPFENLQWMSVLKSLTGFQMYRQQVRLRVRGTDVLRFLMQDTAFPRAVACSLKELSLALKPLPSNEATQAVVDDLVRLLIAADVEELAHEPEQLHLFMDELQVGLNRVHTKLVSHYFDVKHPPRL